MKDSFVHRVARGPIIPLITVICVLLAGAGPARAGKSAQVEVGFVGVPVVSNPGVPPARYQNVLLNVRSIRINPNVDAAPGNAKWQSIAVPPAIGGNGQNADLQIDLSTSQNIPQLFNTAGVQPGTYRIAELILDSANPGSIVPNCPLAPPLGANNDGCINYPIQLAVGTNVISVSNSSGLIFPAKGKLTPLILQVSMAINSAPTTPGGAYTVTITLAPLPSNVLGTVTGSVNVTAGTGSGSSTSGKLLKLAVTAEAIGTNTPIASALVKTGSGCPASPGGCFTLELPAAGGSAAPGFGTLYDLAVAGGADTYAADRLVPLYPGQQINDDFTVTGGKTLGNITGTITDNCVASKAIAGATLQLLIPPNSIASPSSTFCLDSPEQCVAVATAYTDNAGNFPLPGTLSIPPEFANVPPAPKANLNGAYAMEITAPGYDPLIVQAKPGSSGAKKGGVCAPKDSPTGTSFGLCNLALNTGYITGTIPIIPPNPGQTTLVQVFAEDAGTNNIESALPSPIAVTNSNIGSVSFTLNVPTALLPLASFRKFDLFASTIDLYQGVSDPYPGHTIAVLSGVTGPAEQSGHTCNTTTAAFAEQEQITCVGHGSVAGIVGNADLGTSVVLSKQDPVSNDFVQITNTQVQNQSPNTGPNNLYSFCAPADTYWLQTVQMPTPEYSVTPLVSPTPEPMATPTISVIIPTPLPAGGPSPTPTPAIKCPTTCSTNADGTCPGICNTFIQGL